MKIIRIIMLLGLLLTVFCGAQAHDYELKVGEFNVLNVSDDVNVVWVANADSAGYARFSGADRFADAFIFTNNGKGNLKTHSEDWILKNTAMFPQIS